MPFPTSKYCLKRQLYSDALIHLKTATGEKEKKQREGKFFLLSSPRHKKETNFPKKQNEKHKEKYRLEIILFLIFFHLEDKKKRRIEEENITRVFNLPCLCVSWEKQEKKTKRRQFFLFSPAEYEKGADFP